MIGGFCLETGKYWRYELDPAERSRFYGSSKAVAGENDISINVLELLGMVVSAWVLVSPCAERPSATGNCILWRGGNEAAGEWVRRCRGGEEPRSGALMRLLGGLELSSGWHFDAKHVRGVFNVAADGISRWDRDHVRTLLCVRPDVPWQTQDLGVVGTALCTSVLASSSCANAVAVSFEQTYLGHFSAWVDFRVRCGVPVFFQHSRDDMANVWGLFEYEAYAFATKTRGRRPSKVTCRRSNTFTEFPRFRAQHYPPRYR